MIDHSGGESLCSHGRMPVCSKGSGTFSLHTECQGDGVKRTPFVHQTKGSGSEFRVREGGGVGGSIGRGETQMKGMMTCIESKCESHTTLWGFWGFFSYLKHSESESGFIGQVSLHKQGI